MGKRVLFRLGPFFVLAAFVLLVPTSVEGPGPPGASRIEFQSSVSPLPLAAETTKARVKFSFGKLPLSFERNQGQTSEQVKFLSRGSGYTLFLTSDEAVLALTSVPKKSSKKARSAFTGMQSAKGDVLRMKLLRANSNARAVGLAELPGKSNYFIGKDRKKWRTHVPNYAKVHYQHVYPGIDLVYYGNQRQLEYDFVVAPGADLRAIKLEIAGTKSSPPLSLSKDGELVIKAVGGEVRLHKPTVYQILNSESNGSTRKSIDGHFVLLAKNRVGFEVTPYDKTKPLYIDPVINYATYLGGSDSDYANGVAVDSKGNAYLIGATESPDFPLTSGDSGTAPTLYDVFVTKLSADGSSLVYSTFLGGNGLDEGTAIAVDAAGNTYLTGYTTSSNFPTANGFQDRPGGTLCGGDYAFDYACYDAFVTKLNPTGSALLYSTYLGGSEHEETPYIALGGTGNAYVAGTTESSNFPTLNPIQASFHGGACIGAGSGLCPDLFVAKINPSAVGAASLVYSTYLGGSDMDVTYSVAVDGNGNAYVAGDTFSKDFPTTAGAFQTELTLLESDFVTKINAAGSAFVYSTFIGGGWAPYGALAMAVDTAGNAYVTGLATQALPVTPGAFDTGCGTANECNNAPDAFVTKLNPAGTQLVYCTYLGGDDWDWPYGIAADALGNAYVTGLTNSVDFPVANAVYPSCHLNNGHCSDAFLTKLSPGGEAVIFSTYLGGSGEDGGYGIALDSSRNAYVVGGTSSVDFPATSGAYKTMFLGSTDAFAVKLSGLVLPAVVPSARTLNFGNQVVGTTSPKQTVTIKNVGDAPAATLSFNISGDFQFTQDCEATMAPGTGCTMDVTFTPQDYGPRTGEVKTYNNITGQWETFITLTGSGVRTGLGISSPNLTFSDQLIGTTSKAQTVTLTNTGSVPVNFASIQPATNFTHTTTCPNSLAVGANCTINVIFAPNATGSMTGQITITDDAPGSPHMIALNGKGTDFSIMPASGTGIPTATVTAGESVNYKLKIIPAGFSGNVAMGCTWSSGQPKATSCTVWPTTASLDGTNAIDVSVSVTTTERYKPSVLTEPQPSAPNNYPAAHLAISLLALAALASIALHKRRLSLGLASVLFVAVLWTACGGGGGETIPPFIPVEGTPAGTYSLSVNATFSGATRSTALTLVVK